MTPTMMSPFKSVVRALARISLVFLMTSEQWILSALLQKPDLWPHCHALEAGDFQNLHYQKAFQAMLAEDKALDLLTLHSFGAIQREYLADFTQLADERIILDPDVLREHVVMLLAATRDREAKADMVKAVDRFRERTKSDRRDLPDIQPATAIPNQIPPPELIHGILHQGSKLALGGGSKTFKTWVLIDIAMSIANGKPWLAFPTSQGRVLYANFEIQPVFFQHRLDHIAEAKKITRDNLDIWNLRGHSAEAGRILPIIGKRVQDTKYSLIILDPIYKLYGAIDENKAGDIAQLLNHLEHLAVTSGAAVAFGAHFSKGNQAAKESIDRISGSGVFARDPDSLLIFTPHRESEAFTVEATLRNLKPVDPFVVRWKFPIMVLDDQLDPTDLKVQSGRPAKSDPVKLLEFIKETSRDNPISTSDWAKRAGVYRTTLANYLEELRANGWIETIGDGTRAKKYITPEGLCRLTETH